MIVWMWDADGPDASACGVTDAEERAKRAADAAMRSMGAAATVYAATHLGGGGWMRDGYRPTGVYWTARMGADGDVTWRMGNSRLAVAS